MGTITLSSEDSGSNSILSNIFIDYYMPEANGTFVKVYLYLLRLQQSNRQMCSLSEVADHLNCTDNDVSRAIKYWIGKGLLQYHQDEKGNPIGLILCQPQSPESLGQTPRIVDFHVVRPEEPKTSTGKKTSRKQPTVRELQKALEDPQFLELRAQAEAYFDRPLSDKDINALWFIYDDLKLPFGLCEYLLEYCAEDKGKHPERMEADYYRKIASSWAEQGITSREDAQKATNRRFFGTQLLRALGIRDRYIPTDAEIRMIEDWRTRFGFSDEMLILACETALRLGIAPDAIARGISTARHPGRLELLSCDPVILYDGGHNPNGITALNGSLDRYFPGCEMTVIFACMKDKDIAPSLRLLAEPGRDFLFTTVQNNPRALPALDLAAKAAALGIAGEPCDTLAAALERAKERGKMTLICGSLYLYADLPEDLRTI